MIRSMTRSSSTTPTNPGLTSSPGAVGFWPTAPSRHASSAAPLSMFGLLFAS
ncbi:rhamnogalacturonate lyase-like protein [Corchorus olitorius]|uniref:Rhamnogalacturonate lyase-like protein n=1 Tax=Corchorus olitorius TaxID=93759 RepID=A0A1R3G1B3_9ROSI|nr:rhamnogalacturonate lyase-like protein [Corchorus olitorius]